jgi:hypothetical protein
MYTNGLVLPYLCYKEVSSITEVPQNSPLNMGSKLDAPPSSDMFQALGFECVSLS